MKQIILCITGGHLTPALAVIEEIRRQNLNWKIFFIGRSHAFEGKGSPTQEKRLIQACGIPFYALVTGRQGSSLWKVPIGFFQSFFLLVINRPSAVLSFGGYIALPVAIAACILRIPIITHEQTGELGLANKIIARFARQVIFSGDSGVPIRRSLFAPPEMPSFPVDRNHPILYVSGGSTGAHSLNALIFPIVSELIKSWTVIHQVGVNDMPKAQSVADQYVASGYFDAPDVSWMYHHATLFVGRSGANTTAEVAAFGVPAIFIPLPWSAGNEQMNNARVLEREGMAVIAKQEEISPEALIRVIEKMKKNIGELKRSAEKVAKGYPRDGAEKVVTGLRSILS